MKKISDKDLWKAEKEMCERLRQKALEEVRKETLIRILNNGVCPLCRGTVELKGTWRSLFEFIFFDKNEYVCKDCGETFVYIKKKNEYADKNWHENHPY
jgi:transposase-like protein